MTRISQACLKLLVAADKTLDYIPFVSTINNSVDLIQKFTLKKSYRSNPKNLYASHLNQKSFRRCAILLVPVVGNILNVALYKSQIKFKVFNKNKAHPKPIQQNVRWKAPESLSPSDIYLKNIWDSFIKNHPKPEDPASRTFCRQHVNFLYLRFEYNKQNPSGASPCALFANPMLDFKNSKDVFYIPKVGESPEYLRPAKQADCAILIDSLKASFNSGKKMLVTQLTTQEHAIAAGFLPTGEFKLIDSVGGSIVDINELTKALNDAKIADANGNLITFKGEYINTHLQKNSSECQRFSMLYCYQMAKRLDLNAYEEVNGAFLDGKLMKYEDYDKIDGVTKVKDVGSQTPDYFPFMRSWSLRICGFSVNDWKQIPLSELNGPNMDNEGQIGIYRLMFDKFPIGDGGFEKGDAKFKENKFELMLDDNGKKVSVLDENITLGDPLTDKSVTIDSLYPTDETTWHYLIFEKGNPTPRLFRPSPGQKLYGVEHTPEGETFEFKV